MEYIALFRIAAHFISQKIESVVKIPNRHAHVL